MRLRNQRQLHETKTKLEQNPPQSRLSSFQLKRRLCNNDEPESKQQKAPAANSKVLEVDSSTLETPICTSADNTISCASNSTCADNANIRNNEGAEEGREGSNSESVLNSTISYPSPSHSCSQSEEPPHTRLEETNHDLSGTCNNIPQHERNPSTLPSYPSEQKYTNGSCPNNEQICHDPSLSSKQNQLPLGYQHSQTVITTHQCNKNADNPTNAPQNELSSNMKTDASVTNAATDSRNSPLSTPMDQNDAISIMSPSLVHTENSRATSNTAVHSPKVPIERPTREDVMRRLSEALLRRSLTMIDMSQRGLLSSDARLLKIALKQNSFLSTLKLGYNQLADEGTSTLAEGIATHLNISSVDLGFNQVGDIGCQALAKAILSSTNRRRAAISAKLTSTSTLGQRVSSTGSDFSSTCSDMEGFHTLYLSGNCIGEEGACALAEVVKAKCGLKRMHLTGNGLGPDGIRVLMDAMIECETAYCVGNLSIIDNDEEPTKEMNGVNTRKKSFVQTATKTTSQKRMRTQSQLFSDMLSKNPYQTTNHRLDHSAQLLVPQLQDSLFPGHGIEELFLGGTGMGHSGCLAVAKMIRHTTSLRVLSLANCNLGDNEIALLANAIMANERRFPIERLQLSFNNITHKGIESLLPSTFGLQSLKELQLDNNRIESRGAQLLATVLQKVKTLNSLDIGFNSITGSGMRTLMKAVSESSELASLSVSGNAIDNGSAKAVAYALAHNKSLKALFLDHCKLQSEGQRHITAGIVSNSQTRLNTMTGFLIGGNAVSLGLPSDLEKWSNEQVLKFILIMWRHMQQEQEGNIVEKDIDPLSLLQGTQCNSNVESGHAPTYSGPLDPATVVSAAKRAYAAISQNEQAMFVLSTGCSENVSFQSPLAEDAIMLEIDDSNIVLQKSSLGFDTEVSTSQELLDSGSHTPPIPGALELKTCHKSSITALDLATRKKKIIEWLCDNIHHLNDLNQLPFNSSELWRLHQHFFTPSIQESCSQTSSLPPSQLVDDLCQETNSPPGSSILSEPCNVIPSPVLNDEPPASAPVMNNSNGTIPMLKRKVSYRCLHDSTINNISTRNKYLETQSVSKVIEGRLNGMQPKSKRARKTQSRISIVPRIKEKLESFLDSDHQKALGLMRQLQYVEKSLLSSCIYPLNNGIVPTYLSDALALDAEMILLDM